MDSWPRDQQQPRQKRNFTEMNAGTSLSPSPHLFSRLGSSTPSDSISSFAERRRTSHPHNHSLPPRSTFTPDIMAESRPHQRPSLEHRTSQTIIDLTGDVDVPVTGGRQNHLPERPPRFTRTDNISLGDIIDLTEDDDIQITHVVSRSGATSRQSIPPRPRSSLFSRVESREDSPLFVPRDDELPPVPHREPPQLHMPRFMAAFGPHLGHFREFGHAVQNVRERYVIFGGGEALPHIHLDYQAGGFGPPPKPNHEAPPAVPDGFTRSPTEEDVIVCPSCDEELIAKKVDNEPPIKKSGKAPSKKDREEHPFWVVKSCGHVYCNACFLKARKPQKSEPDSKFPTIHVPSSSKPNSMKVSRACAVEDCNADVGEKKHWCGIFL